MIRLHNLTPHAINVFAADGTTLLVIVPPSGEIARVSFSRVKTGVVPIEGDAEALLREDPLAGIPVFVNNYGAVSGLPAPQFGTIYVVSAMVRQAVPTRRDVLSPGELIRDAAGQPIGCRGLEANS
jgi:hypothetical protein